VGPVTAEVEHPKNHLPEKNAKRMLNENTTIIARKYQKLARGLEQLLCGWGLGWRQSLAV
jgi:hypothetical protein